MGIMITRILIVVGLIFGCGLCLAEDLRQPIHEMKSLTGEQAAGIVVDQSRILVGYQLSICERAYLSLQVKVAI